MKVTCVEATQMGKDVIQRQLQIKQAKVRQRTSPLPNALA